MMIIREDFPEKGRLLELVVKGKPLSELSLASIAEFSSNDEIGDWIFAFWSAFDYEFVEKAYEGFGCLSDILISDFCEGLDRRHVELDEAARLNAPVTVDGIDYKAIHVFDVLHCGWELDKEGAIVETPEGRKLVLSNHGRRYFAQPNELQEKLAEYRQAIADSEKGLSLLE